MAAEKNILHGASENISDNNDSYGQTIYKSLLNGGNNVAMVDAKTGEELTYSSLKVKTLTIAQFLKDYGLRKNDVISVCSPNSLDFFVPAISALYLGIIVAPINHMYTPREIAHALNISKPKIIFTCTSALRNILEAKKHVPSIEKIILYGKIKMKNLDTLDSLLTSNKRLNPSEMTTLEPDHVAGILCSSGTTGQAKGVELTHGNFLTAARHLGKDGHGQLTPGSVSIAILPFFHAYGFNMFLANIIINIKIIVLEKFEEKLFLSAIEKYKVVFAPLVPPVIVFLAKSPLISKYDLSSFKEILCGAAPLKKDIQDLVQKRLNLKSLRQGYGLTESTLALTITPLGTTKAGTSGIVAPGMKAKVINPSTGEALGPNQEGELCFKGPLIMKKYHENPKATDEMIDKDGWMHTGDLGYYDEDGYFYVVDRMKELIKYKGFQVPPAELEALLITNPKIREAAVIGIPDEKCGELPLAFVVKAPNVDLTEKEVIKFVEKNVSYHKRLHGGVRFVTEIPKNPSGKILRRILRESLKLKSKI